MELGDAAELIREIADLQEVLDCMVAAIGKTSSDVAAIQKKKNAKAGSFKQKLFVDTVETPDDAPWLQYLLNNPDRYPEIPSSSSK